MRLLEVGHGAGHEDNRTIILPSSREEILRVDRPRVDSISKQHRQRSFFFLTSVTFKQIRSSLFCMDPPILPCSSILSAFPPLPSPLSIHHLVALETWALDKGGKGKMEQGVATPGREGDGGSWGQYGCLNSSQ